LCVRDCVSLCAFLSVCVWLLLLLLLLLVVVVVVVV
jgi:hypothetical protein